jgi:23S rRNA (uracil1939-C5)-methyltransferase
MKKDEILDIDIVSLNSEGKGIAKTDEGFVIFIPKTLPGDKAKIKITKKKSNYADAELIELIEKSKDRVEPQCKHFGVCGGCKIQNYDYKKQIEYKTQTVRDAFKKIGGFDDLVIPDALPSEDLFYYRNKMEYSFSTDEWVNDVNLDEKNHFALGLHVPNFHSKILNIEECFLQSKSSSDILIFTRDFFKQKNISIYNTKTHTGFLRFLIIRQCRNTKDFMVNLVTYDYDEKLINEYTNDLLKHFPDITTVVNSFSQKKAQIAFGDSSVVTFGEGYIYEQLKNATNQYKFKISPNSFFQTNSRQTENLYSIASAFLDLKKDDNILDLYCGAGSITIFISDKINKVCGVELISDAVENAKENAKINNIDNAEFILSDIKDFFETIFSDEKYIEYNKVILDPPRSGLHPQICNILSESNFEKICYISCNPVTQARDLKIICSKGKYRIENIHPVDMFPQTYHIENVVSISRIN